MVRPLSGVVAIAQAIGPQLAKRRGPGQAAAVHVLSQPLSGLAAVAEHVGSRLIADLNRSTS
jgi:hypothetical protein